MKKAFKIMLASLVMVTFVSCKDGNSNEGSQSYKDNHPQDTLETPKGDSARVENDTYTKEE